jgi:transposase InsO family protein
MNREVHVRFWEGVGVQLLCATRLSTWVREGDRGAHRAHQVLQLYNERRSHQSLEYRTPDEVYVGELAGVTPIAV